MRGMRRGRYPPIRKEARNRLWWESDKIGEDESARRLPDVESFRHAFRGVPEQAWCRPEFIMAAMVVAAHGQGQQDDAGARRISVRRRSQA